MEQGIEAETIHLDGAVESSVQLGVADLIADVVSTGTTAGSESMPLLGTAIRSMVFLQMLCRAGGRNGKAPSRAPSSQILVNVFERDAAVDHHDLHMVQQLAHLWKESITTP